MVSVDCKDEIYAIARSFFDKVYSSSLGSVSMSKLVLDKCRFYLESIIL